jgi:hypothetical protein
MVSTAAVKQMLIHILVLADISSAVSVEASGSGEKMVVRRAQSEESDGESMKVNLMEHGMARRVTHYQRFSGFTCGSSYNSEPLVSKASVGECQKRCSANMNCGCVELDRISGACYMKKRGACRLDSSKCKRSVNADVYLQQAVWGRDPLKLQRSQGRDCLQEESERGAVALAPPAGGMALDDCRGHCAADEDCTCFQWDRFHGTCHKMKQCTILKCAQSRSFDVYVQTAAKNGYGDKYSGSTLGL